MSVRVLHIEAGKHLYGGARQVLYIVDGMARQGISQLLVCPDGSSIASAARALGVNVVELPMDGEADLVLAFRLRKLIRKEKITLVHCHSRRGADIWGGVAAMLAGVPCVLSRRVDNPEPAWWCRLKYRLFDQVITISEGIRQVLLSQGVPAAKVICVRSALDAAEWQHPEPRATFLETFGLPDQALTVAIVAQLIERKGHAVVLAALPRLVAAFPDLRLLVFGRGPLQATLERQVAEMGLSPFVVFAGFRDDLSRWMGCLDVVVHPAYMEGLGVSLLQASAAAVPLVAAAAGGIPEVICDGKTGILLAPGPHEGWHDALATLLANPELRYKLGENGRAWIECEFSVQTMVAGNLAVYQRVQG